MSLEFLMLVAGILLVLCVFTNRISDKFGIPGLLVFIAIGISAGYFGNINFQDSLLSNRIGTIALAFILFAGGIDTKWTEVKPVLFRGGILSTAGVFLTALFLFLCTYFVLGFSFEMSLLLSVIVSSTDAPAVFAILRSQKRDLKSPLKPILEFESGSNDPMAVLLSMGAISLLSSTDFDFFSSMQNLLWQIVFGVTMGIFAGRVAGYYLSRWHLIYSGLYPVFGVGFVLVTYSLTQLLQGNGFLAVYIAGIFLGNTAFMHRRQFIKFQDSLAWIMQIGMFLILGLLVNVKELWSVLPVSFACALCLMFIARPLAVFLCLHKSEFDTKDKIFISWAGFKGAVPIILATYPLIAKFPNSQFLFNLVFFLVILSVLVQGKTLTPLAKRLGLYKKEEIVETNPVEKPKHKKKKKMV